MTPNDPSPAPVVSTTRRTWVRRFGMFLGVALLLAALVMIWRQREVVSAALAELTSPDPLLIGLLLLAVLGNIALSGVTFSVLIARYGRVGVIEMQALVAATTLVNYLPLRPGLFGRLAYHRAVNGIPVRHGVTMVVEALTLTGVIGACIALMAWLSMRYEVSLPLMTGAPAALLVVMALLRPVRRWGLAGLCRYAELLIWAARYHLAFALIGAPIDWPAALAMACVGVLATLVPFVSNGLGVREWAIGLLAPLLTGQALEFGLTAELVNRAAELIVVSITGLIGLTHLAQQRRASRARANAAPPSPDA